MTSGSPPKESSGTDAAYGARHPHASQARFAACRALKIAGRRHTRGRIDFLEFAPSVSDATEFTDLSTRVACYLGDAGLPLYLPGPRFSLDPAATPFFEPSLVRDPGWLHERPAGRAGLVVHRLTPRTLKRILVGPSPSTSVDTRLHAYSELQYFVLRNAASWPTYAPVETALERLRSITDGARGLDAFILATGPSAVDVDLSAVDAAVRITCNSAVRDMDRIRAFRPNIIACTDPVFHLGPSRYAAAFRADLIRAAEESDAIVVAGSDWAGPLLGLCPELHGRLAVIPFEAGGPWRWPTSRDPTVRPSSSVLTNLMLPLALMLADDVQIAGADGRQTTETYFWRHNKSLQYSDDLMQTVFDAHPAFFRDRDYEDFYDGYCQDVEALASLGEATGKTVRAAAPSWIPALRRRGAPAPSTTTGRGQPAG